MVVALVLELAAVATLASGENEKFGLNKLLSPVITCPIVSFMGMLELTGMKLLELAPCIPIGNAIDIDSSE